MMMIEHLGVLDPTCMSGPTDDFLRPASLPPGQLNSRLPPARSWCVFQAICYAQTACLLRPGAPGSGGARTAAHLSVSLVTRRLDRSARGACRPAGQLRKTCPARGQGPWIRRAATCGAGAGPAECGAGGTQRWTHGDPVAPRAGARGHGVRPPPGRHLPAARAASGASPAARQPHVCASIDHVTRTRALHAS
jgi:hypothetical protein